MLYLTHTPAWPLSQFVDKLWIYTGEKKPHDKERLLPDGCMELVINLHANNARVYDRNDINRFESFPGAILCGVQSEYFVIDTAEQLSVMGAHFHPGGAFQFFKLPAGELHGLHLGLDVLWGAGTTGNLREGLLAEPTIAGKFRIFERTLIANAVKGFDRHPAVGYALKEFHAGSRPVADVTDEIGLSARRFIEVFRAEVGLTPKLFCRIRRFQKIVRLVGGGKDVDWADAALACGYFDQAHFIHDFRAFSGINPSAYLVQKTEHLNHVPIVE